MNWLLCCLATHIPLIGVDSNIEHVGLTPGGAMDVPKNPFNSAWFKLGPTPGDKGSAVIDGHSGWKDNTPAVFDNLYQLKKGDKIYVEDGQGVTKVFIVNRVEIYDPDADTTKVFSSNDNKQHLNLITCEGIWDEVKKSHSKRLVVFSDME